MKMSAVRPAGRTLLRPAACASRSVSLFSHSAGDVVLFNFAYRGNDPSTRVHFITRQPPAGAAISAAGAAFSAAHLYGSPYRLPPSVLPGPESFWRTGFTEVPLLTATMRDGQAYAAYSADAAHAADAADADRVRGSSAGRPDARGTWKASKDRRGSGVTGGSGGSYSSRISGRRATGGASDEGTTVLVGFEDGDDAFAAASTEAAIRCVPGGVDVASFSLEDARMLGGMMRVPLLLLLAGGDRSGQLAAYFAPHAEPTPRIPA